MVSLSYDAAGRTVSVSQPVNGGTKTISYSYDKVGNKTGMVDAEELATAYVYDNADRMTSMTNSEIGTTSYQYDGAGRLTKQTNGNGTYTDYSYDTAGRLWKVENRKSDTSLLSSFTYTLDAAGNRTQVSENMSGTTATVDYTYDDINRLTGEHRTGSNAYWYKYEYDGSGNRTYVKDGNNGDAVLKSYAYDAANKLLTETVGGTSTTYSYDQNGNTTGKATGASSTELTWNYEDKMVAFDDGTNELEFRTDAEGFRRTKEVGTAPTHFLYDLAGVLTPGLAPVLAEYDSTGTLVVKYTYGGGVAAQKRGADKRWYMPDALGTTRQLTSDSEVVTDSYILDAWGGSVASSGTTVNPFVYVGRENYYTDTQSGLLLLGVRYYDPATGRFVTQDPIGLAGGDLDLYRYVRNNPMDKVDPGGLKLTAACGKCGGNIRKWIIPEIEAQFIGFYKFYDNNKTFIDRQYLEVADYAWFALVNQMYKVSKEFAFSSGAAAACGTEWDPGRSPGCGRSVTIGSSSGDYWCVKSAVLGNVMFGYMGRLAIFSAKKPWSLQDLKKVVRDIKGMFRAQVDAHDEAAYEVGWCMAGSRGLIRDYGSFVAAFRGCVNSFALRQQGKRPGDEENYQTCLYCQSLTGETRHGGWRDTWDEIMDVQTLRLALFGD